MTGQHQGYGPTLMVAYTSKQALHMYGKAGLELLYLFKQVFPLGRV